MATKARLQANARCAKKAYDQILVRFPKGASETLKALAAADGQSVNRYILEAVERRSGQKFALNKSITGGEAPTPAPTQDPAPVEKEITLKIKISVDE